MTKKVETWGGMKIQKKCRIRSLFTEAYDLVENNLVKVQGSRGLGTKRVR